MFLISMASSRPRKKHFVVYLYQLLNCIELGEKVKLSCIWISTAISRPRKSHFHSPKGAAGAHNVEMWKHNMEMWKHNVEIWKHTKLEANTQLHSGNRIRSNNRRRKKQKNYKTYEEIDIHTNQLNMIWCLDLGYWSQHKKFVLAESVFVCHGPPTKIMWNFQYFCKFIQSFKIKENENFPPEKFSTLSWDWG